MPRLHVSLFLPDSDNPYQKLQAENAAAAADRLEITLDVDFAEGDFALQIRQIIKTTRQDAERPDVVLVMPVQEAALKGLSEETVRAGTGWVFLNRTPGNVEQLRRVNPRVPVSYVSPDQKAIGRVQARIVRSLFPGGAHVLLVTGRAVTSSAQERSAGFWDELAAPGPAVQVAGTLDGNWSAPNCESVVTRWLSLTIPSGGRLDAIVCQSDFMATGALDALRIGAERLGRPGLASLPVVGCDGMMSMGKKLVDEGRLAATVVVSTTADKALQAIAAAPAGTSIASEILLPPHAYPDEANLARRARRAT